MGKNFSKKDLSDLLEEINKEDGKLYDLLVIIDTDCRGIRIAKSSKAKFQMFIADEEKTVDDMSPEEAFAVYKEMSKQIKSKGLTKYLKS